ncbi:hypothetical protein ACEN2H_12740, partial [Flavobacterium sp. W22_SRS_FP1]
DTGATGAQGDKGDQGIQGLAGATGAQGDKGEQGIQGFPGAASTVAGPQGIQGEIGVTGPQGVQGLKGETGATGAQGPIGSPGITSQQATDINTNNAKVGITTQQASDIIANNAKVGITIAQSDAITANTAKTGITAEQASEISVNTSKVGFTDALVSANADVLANKAKVGITTAQSDAITANTLKTGITTAQVNEISANTAKIGFTDASVSANADVLANKAKVGIATAQSNAITANTSKVGFTDALVSLNSDVVANKAKVGITPAQATAIATNAGAITTLEGEQTAQNTAIALNTAKVSYPGDQNISGIATNNSAISTLQGEQTTQNSAIALNTAKKGITSQQASDITANTVKTGITIAQSDAITANTAKTGITAEQASEISVNTSKVGFTHALVSANSDVVANKAKVGITPAQATAITTNVGDISTLQREQTTQNTAIALNTAKVSYPGDQDISGIATNNSAISTLQGEQITQNSAIALNGAITTVQATNIETNKDAISTLQGEQTTQNTAIALNTAKVGITTTQSNAITANTVNIATNATAIAAIKPTASGTTGQVLTMNTDANPIPIWADPSATGSGLPDTSGKSIGDVLMVADGTVEWTAPPVASPTTSGFLSSTDYTLFGSSLTTISNRLNDFIPYGGAVYSVDLGAHDLRVQGLTIGLGNNGIATNTAFGDAALINNNAGFNNTAVGNNALLNNIDGSRNVAVGFQTGKNVTSGSGNTIIGTGSGSGITTGGSNVVIGSFAAETFNGDNNTIIGVNAILGTQDLSNSTAIGYQASVGTSNTIQLGNTSVTNVNTSGAITGTSFIKSGGIGTQFLKADGTVDINEYLTTTGTAASATNLAGGLGGQIPYQSAAGTTALLSNGNVGQVLQSNGTTAAPSWADLSASGGLVSVTENSKTGYRRADANAANYGDIGSKAVDISSSSATSTTMGATGSSAVAMGISTTASGPGSTAMGNGTLASNIYSTAMGSGSKATGNTAVAMGNSTEASGQYTTAMGYGTKASGTASTAMGMVTSASDYGSLVIGAYNEGGNTESANGSATAFDRDNTAFVIGNGNSFGRSDAFKVLFNGNTTIAADLNVNGPVIADIFVGSGSGLTGTATALNIGGNALTATKLATPRNINGIAFDGTANITIPSAADASALTGTTLASTVTGSSLTSVGTLGSLTVTSPIIASVTGNAATVTTNANLTGDVTSVGNATTLSNAAVIGQVLTGYTAWAGHSLETITATDNILEAIQKIDGNFTGLSSGISSLRPGHIFVGSLNGTGTEAVLLQGDATVGTNGVVITNDAITSSKILDGTVLNADISASAAIAQSKISGLTTDLASKALIESPSFTGIPLAPTATAGISTEQIATTKFVTTAIAGVNAAGGLVSVTEGANTGYRRADAIADNYGNIGLSAVDLSNSPSASTTMGATGENSIAMGESTTASAPVSVAMGYSTIASDYGSVVLGQYNNKGSVATSATTFSATAPALVIGNGAGSSAKSDAFVVDFSGNITASGSMDLNGAAATLNSILADDPSNVTGATLLVQAEPSNNIALQIFGNNSADYYSGGKIVFGDYSPGNFGVAISEVIDNELAIRADYVSFESEDLSQTGVYVDGRIWVQRGGITVKEGHLDLRTGSYFGDGSMLENLSMANTTGLQDSLNAKAPKNNPTFLGAVTADSFIGDAAGLTGLSFTTNAGVTSNGSGIIASDDFVFGSTKLDDISGVTADNSRFFFDKSKGAFRAGAVSSSEWNSENVGDYSVGMGYNSEPTGKGAVAMGAYAIASGIGAVAMGAEEDEVGATTGPNSKGRGSVAMGIATTASAMGSVALGVNTLANASSSFAFGLETAALGANSVAGGSYARAEQGESVAIGSYITANTFGEVVLGRYNAPASRRGSWDSTDPLFTIGNGTSSLTSNAFQILKNGNATLKGTLTATKFVGDGSGLTGVTASSTITDGSITSAHIADATLVDADISPSAAIAQSKISGLASSLAGKQNTITDGGLTIAKTSGLQAALDGKQNTITDGGLTIAKTTGLQTALDGKAAYIIPGTAGNVLTSDGTDWVSQASAGSTITVGSIGGSSNANGATIDTSGVLNLTPADATNGGVVTTGNQTFAGAKTFSSDLAVNGLKIGRGNGNLLNNTVLGNNALVSNTTGKNNDAIGYRALRLNKTGSDNDAIGYLALSTNVGGSSNVAIGANTLLANVSGSYNLAIGAQALKSNTNSDNIAIGAWALANNTTGGSNTAIGSFALISNGAGDGNIAIGGNVGGLNTSGSKNTAIGESAFQINTTGSYNTVIGYNADISTDGLENATAIGANAKVSASHTIQLGSDGTTGTAIANVKTSGTLTAGTVTYPNIHNSIAGEVLTTNAAGVASWAAPSSSIAAGDITSTLILDGTITDEDIGTSEISSIHILNGTIIDEDIADGAAIDQSKIAGLTTSLNAKQNTINDGGLTISKTSGLQTALDGKAALASSPTFTGTVKATRFELPEPDSHFAVSNTTLDLSSGNLLAVALENNIEILNIINAVVGTYLIKFVQSSSGNYTVSFPTAWKWSGGTVPTVTATARKTDIVTLIYDGRTFYAAISQNF